MPPKCCSAAAKTTKIPKSTPASLAYVSKNLDAKRTEKREDVKATEKPEIPDSPSHSRAGRESSPKTTGRGIRHDPDTGCLKRPEEADTHSASDALRFLNSKRFHDHPLAYPFGIMVFVGGLGSGKSTTIYSILEELGAVIKPSLIDSVLYYTGSAGDKTRDLYDEDEVEMYEPKSKESFLERLRSIYESSGQTPHEKKKLNIIVVEDAINDAEIIPHSIKSTTPLSKVMMAARHIPATVIISGQKYSALPTFARTNASHIFVFGAQSPSEIEAIGRDIPFAKETFKHAMQSMTAQGKSLWIQKHSRRMVMDLTEPCIY